MNAGVTERSLFPLRNDDFLSVTPASERGPPPSAKPQRPSSAAAVHLKRLGVQDMRKILLSAALATAMLAPAVAVASPASAHAATSTVVSASTPRDGGDWGRHRRHFGRFGRFGFGFPFASPFLFNGGFGGFGFGGFGGECIALGGELFCPVI
jgi:hypothetical protein